LRVDDAWVIEGMDAEIVINVFRIHAIEMSVKISHLHIAPFIVRGKGAPAAWAIRAY
jgi:hypothetical protein